MPYAFVVSFPLRFHLLNLFEKRCTVWRIVLTPDLNILWITFMWGAELNPEKKRDQNCKICFVRRPQTHNHITNRCMFHFITRCMNRRIALWGVSKGLKPPCRKPPHFTCSSNESPQIGIWVFKVETTIICLIPNCHNFPLINFVT